MRKHDLELTRVKLVELRDRLQHEIGAHADSISEQVQAPGEVTDLPTHNADHDVEGLEAELAVGAIQREELREVEAALDRIDAGAYGKCELCGGPINLERLDALPYTSLCVDCECQREAAGQ